ncbi:hypothetical protein [uncultured Corynebacterium sp.]|uniref:hypothetical protein n=1 Tax=uncultured Corynebacterium sp. TaxID=159447 RepID=UPI0028E44275|nr:hypothetical protein [uncultured Corynebacterium sp.]
MGASVNWDRLVVVGSLGFVVVMVLVGAFAVHDDGPVSYATRPDQYSAGPVVDQAVGRAIEKYREVLDEGKNSPDCTLSDCPISSKYIPGVPEDRALFTDAEEFELEMFPPGKQARSGFSLYSVNRQDDGMVEVIAYVVAFKCFDLQDGGGSSGGTFLHRMLLAPSQVDEHEYVVIKDDFLPMTMDHVYPDSFDPLYSSRGSVAQLKCPGDK